MTALALLTAGAMTAPADIVTQWDFESDDTTPSTGAGTANLIGGTTATFATGNPGRGWNTSTYPSQGTASGTAGVSFFISTVEYEDVSIAFDHRASGTASRWAQLDYTLDGGANWVTGFWNNNGGLTQDTFHSFNVDLTAIAGANENPDVGFRIVSIFSPLAFDQNASLPDYDANTAYMRANAQASYTPRGGTGTGDYGVGGTWRFDNVTLNATLIPEPASATLLGLAGAALLIFRRRK